MSRRLILTAIIAVVVVIFGLSLFVMPITSVFVISENIEMSENLVIEASGFYLSPWPRPFNCAEVYYTISWWDDNEGEWMRVFEKPMAECVRWCFYINEDYYLTWSPEEDGWGWWKTRKENDALPGHYKINITVLGDDHEFEFFLSSWIPSVL